MIKRSLSRRILGWTCALCVLLALGAAAAGFWFKGRINASLPRLDGAWTLRGLTAPVRVTRDSGGVPTVTASNRGDVARAMGWLHAQDRFFQMDTLRRRGAGELSELFGSAALPLDREARMHAFRRLAREALARESPARRALVEAYAEGVNGGLAALGAAPWEYAVLRTRPKPWLPEDCLLITYAMTLDLQESSGNFVRSLAAIRDAFGPASLAFFCPESTPADSALDGSRSRAAPIPPSSEVDLRRRAAEEAGDTAAILPASGTWSDSEEPGSNNFALAGRLTAGGGAMVANDMHLRLGVPNIWYRVCLRWPGHEETGVSIPGAPTLVAGSTGRIAWGFTNSGAGVGDVLVINPSISPDLYHGPDKDALVPYDKRTETIEVRGSKPVATEFDWTVWGPVIGDAPNGRKLVYHWTMDDPAAVNLAIMDLEDASDVREAVGIAHHMGIPVQNMVVADASGQIAWTIAGFLPKRVGYDGRLPVSWAFGDRRWEGYLPAADIPSVVAPGDGLLWTANNRTVGGKALEALGDSGYAIPARAHQIREDLDALVRSSKQVGPRDLLAVQLDDRAVLLEGWRKMLLETLLPEVVARKPSRAAALRAVQKWEGRAATDSVSYRIVRAFRQAVAHKVFDPIFAPCVDLYPQFRWTRLNYEEPLETLLKSRPAHLLDPSFASWDDLLVAALDDVTASLARAHEDIGGATWGRRNTAQIRHPLAGLFPRWASGWLAMPPDPLPGDENMPLVQGPSFGASERFVVSPGHEANGIFQMPGGQCANPLSPYFSAGHEAWVHGEPTPFLPGVAEHALSLDP